MVRLKSKYTIFTYLIILMSVVIPRGYGDIMTFHLKPLGKLNRVDLQLSTGFGSGIVKGTFSQVVGKINFSLREPAKSTGQILMDARTLRFGYRKINEDTHNPEWMDSSRFPRVSFNLKSINNCSWQGKIMHAKAMGNLNIKEKSIPLSVPVNLRYLRGERKVYDGQDGDIVYVTGEFPLSRGQFGINTGTALDSVLDSLTVKIQLMAGSDGIRPFLPSRVFGGNP